MTKIIAIDVDDVLAMFTLSTLRALNKTFGTNYKLTDVTSWELRHALGLPEEQAAFVKKLWRRTGWCSQLPTAPGAEEAMAELHEIGEVYPVTAPQSSPTWQHERENWLVDNFKVNHHRIIQTNAKHLVYADIFVEDKVSTLVTWQARHPNGVAVLWKTPANETEAWPGLRATEWGHIINLARFTTLRKGA